MSDSIMEYTEQRAELLATLVLTRRKDVEIIHMNDRFDVGVDLLARVSHPVMNGQVKPCFGVTVKATNEPLADEAAAGRYARKHKDRVVKGLFLFPIVNFLFSMEGDLGYYGWLLEPSVVDGRGPSLHAGSPAEMKRIDKRSVDEIIARVNEWFESMADVVGPKAKNGK